jgi:hypothetical protein
MRRPTGTSRAWWRWASGVIVAASFLLPGPALAAYLPNERIPTDDAIYRDLERLRDALRVVRALSSRAVP